MGFFTDKISAAMGYFGYVKAKPEEAVRFEIRSTGYAVNQKLYDGSIYQTRRNGGELEGVLKTYFGDSYCDVNKYRIRPLFVPVREIVEAYQHVIPGVWGDGVKIAAKVNGRDVEPAILDPITRIWLWSNLDTEKAKIIRWAANFGTVGIRIVARAGTGDRAPRVSIVADHPSRLFNFEEDGEGNVTAVVLKYDLPVNRGTLADPKWETVKVVETITGDEFSITYDDVEQLDEPDRVNRLGFCPYVILRHKDNGTAYGDWAYKGSEGALHQINWRLTRQDKSIDRQQFPKWFGAGGGDAPASVEMGDTAMSWVKLSPDTPTPFLQAIVPQIDQGSALTFQQALRAEFRARQPELVLNDLELLANTSGEALEQSLKAVEKKIGDVRPAYLHAFKRAIQMAISAGQAVGAWPIGGDADYRAGRLDFAFEPMPLLPPTTAQIKAKADADNAPRNAKLDLAAKAKGIGYSDRAVWRESGLSDDQIDTMLLERGDQAILPTE